MSNPTSKDAVEGFEGKTNVCTILTVPDGLTEACDAMWDKHKAWLKATHGPWGLCAYTVAKNKEAANALAPPGGSNKTDRTVYVAWEIYTNQAGLDKHFELCTDEEYVKDLLKIGATANVDVVVLNGCNVTHSLLPKDLVYV